MSFNSEIKFSNVIVNDSSGGASVLECASCDVGKLNRMDSVTNRSNSLHHHFSSIPLGLSTPVRVNDRYGAVPYQLIEFFDTFSKTFLSNALFRNSSNINHIFYCVFSFCLYLSCMVFWSINNILVITNTNGFDRKNHTLKQTITQKTIHLNPLAKPFVPCDGKPLPLCEPQSGGGHFI